MVLSRVAKIWILLAISGSFFVVELAVGFDVGSLALIADAYHMLNDTISLGIALYAIRVSFGLGQTPKTDVVVVAF